MVKNNTPAASTIDLVKSIQPFPSDFTRDIRPIACHSHNDYWRHIPLLDAISVGCTSVEADIWISSGKVQTNNTSELYVGHSTRSLTPDRTLRSLYLDPLLYVLNRLNDNVQGEGRSAQEIGEFVGIFNANPNTTLVLLLDFKHSSSETNIWTMVQEHLQPLRNKGYLTHWDEVENRRIIRPVTIVATGEASFDTVSSSKTNQHKDIFFDAPLQSLQPGPRRAPPLYTQANSYYASVALPAAVGRVRFSLSSGQLQTIVKQVDAAKEHGLLSRYWSTPSWPVKARSTVWEQLIREGVGVLNVDELWTAGLRDWRLCWAVGWGICP